MEAYKNSHNEESLQQVRYSLNVVYLVLVTITCVLGIPGNAFVIWIAGVKMKKKVTTIWYVNLAVSDLLCCLILPFFLVKRVLEYWPYGAAMCKVLPTIISINLYASVFTLTLISLDRVSMVIWPVWAQNHRSVFKARLLCGLAWFLALLVSMPDLIYNKIKEQQNNKIFCYYGRDTQTVYKACLGTRAVFGFFVPLLVITLCSLLISRKVTVGRVKSRKVVRIMVGVVTVFVVCWMPYHTLELVLVHGEQSSVNVAWLVSPLAFSLAYFNSCLNPVLYVFMGQDFKEGVRVSLHHIFENAFREDCREDSTRERPSFLLKSSILLRLKLDT